MTKSIFASKTFWLGAATSLFGSFQIYVNENATNDPLYLVVVGLLTIAARFVTRDPVSITGKK